MMSLYIKGQEVEAMFMYDGDLIDSNDAFYVPVWAERLYRDGYLYYKEYKGSPSELFYKTEKIDMHIPVNSYVFKCCERDYLVILTEDEINETSIYAEDYYIKEIEMAKSRIDTLKKINSDLTDRLRKYEWNHEMMKRMIEGAIK